MWILWMNKTVSPWPHCTSNFTARERESERERERESVCIHLWLWGCVFVCVCVCVSSNTPWPHCTSNFTEHAIRTLDMCPWLSPSLNRHNGRLETLSFNTIRICKKYKYKYKHCCIKSSISICICIVLIFLLYFALSSFAAETLQMSPLWDLILSYLISSMDVSRCEEGLP